MPSNAASVSIWLVLRVMARVVSVIARVTWLAIVYLLTTLPTATPMSSAPVGVPAATRAMIGASAFSVARTRSWCLRARSAARRGLRQATALGLRR
jgi:hypothetical protein